MKTNILSLAFIQIASSVFTGVVILWITFHLLKWFKVRIVKLDGKANVSYSIFMAAVLFSVGLSMSSVVQPLVSYFRLLSASADSTMELAVSFMGYGGLYVGIAYASSLLITFIGIMLYVYLTPLKEFQEIKENNVGVAIVVGTIVITLNLISKSGVALLIESLLPYPDLPPTGI